jgi:hypothetical protein
MPISRLGAFRRFLQELCFHGHKFLPPAEPRQQSTGWYENYLFFLLRCACGRYLCRRCWLAWNPGFAAALCVARVLAICGQILAAWLVTSPFLLTWRNSGSASSFQLTTSTHAWFKPGSVHCIQAWWHYQRRIFPCRFSKHVIECYSIPFLTGKKGADSKEQTVVCLHCKIFGHMMHDAPEIFRYQWTTPFSCALLMSYDSYDLSHVTSLERAGCSGHGSR